MDGSDKTGPSPSDVGRYFLLTYYKKWSENPGSVFSFYGTESFFQHDEVEAVGQAEIQKAIEKMNYENCKTRIHNVVGCYGINESLVLVVGGELSQGNSAPRRFVQNIVLNKQASKKYWVQTDIFQWVDKMFFAVNTPASTPVSAPAQAPVEESENSEVEAKAELPPSQPLQTDNNGVAPPQRGPRSGNWHGNGPPRSYYGRGAKQFHNQGQSGGRGYSHHYNNNRGGGYGGGGYNRNHTNSNNKDRD